MSTGRLSRNNALAGLFVLLCIGLFVLVLVLLTSAGERLIGKAQYTVAFNLADGADGLERGSVVKLGGKRVGRVLSSDLVFDPANPKDVTGIDVQIEVRSDLQFYDDAEVNLVRPLLGTNSAINITRLRVADASRPLAEGGRIRGQLGPPGFLAQADYARVQEIIQRTAKISERADKWTAEIDPRIKPIADDVQRTIANARELTDKASKSWDLWSLDVTAVIAQVKKAAEPFEAIARSVDDGIREARALIAQGDEWMDRNRPVASEILDLTRDLVKKAQGEGYDKVIAILDKAEQSMSHAANVAREADELVTTKSPELKEIVTTALLAAQQLKLATSEIRASPWRLLYQPNRKELENELLYNSIRAYSESLGQVRAAAAALEAATENIAQTPAGRQPAVDAEELAALAAKLKQTLSQSAEQEQRFFERWVRDGGPPGEGAGGR